MLLGVIGWVVAQAAPACGGIEWTPCPGIGVVVSGAAMQCGWLDTGERLDGRAVRLRLAVLRRRPNGIDPAPVVFVPGGPGDGAGLDGAALRRWRRWQQRSGWRHDVVLYDPRATGLSRPHVGCAVGARRRARGPEHPETPGSQRDSAAGAASRCYRALGRDTVARLGPSAQLRDLKTLVDGLGVRRVQLWAVSYGTRIARLFAARHPARVHSLLLDSPVMAGGGGREALPARISRALRALDRYCAAATNRCAGDTRPSELVQSLLQRYQARPPTIMIPQAFVITPEQLLLMVLFTSYETAARGGAVARLARAANGNPAALSALAQRLQRIGTSAARNPSVYWSTRCAFADAQDSRADWRAMTARFPDIEPYLNNISANSVCDRWRVPRVALPDPTALLPAHTLMLTGGGDALVSEARLRRFVRRHPSARWIRVPGAGHAPTLSNACAQQLAARFLTRSADYRAQPTCAAAVRLRR